MYEYTILVVQVMILTDVRSGLTNNIIEDIMLLYGLKKTGISIYQFSKKIHQHVCVYVCVCVVAVDVFESSVFHVFTHAARCVNI